MNIVSLTIPLTSTFTDVLFNLAALGFGYIKINYSGSGDDGCIDSIELLPIGSLEIIDNVPTLTEADNELNYGTPDQDLRILIQDQAYNQVLDNAEDWCNNEGGGGILYISTLDNSFHSDHYIYITETVESIITGKIHNN